MIRLKIEGKEKEFFESEMTAKTVRIAMDIQENTDFRKIKARDLDTIIDFLVSAYGNQFTQDDVWDGLTAKDFMKVLINQLTYISNSITDIAKEVTPEGE